MQFKNDSHEKLFLKTIKGMNQRDNTQMALAFLKDIRPMAAQYSMI